MFSFLLFSAGHLASSSPSHACSPDMCPSYEELVMPSHEEIIPTNARSLLMTLAKGHQEDARPLDISVVDASGAEVEVHVVMLNETSARIDFVGELQPESSYRVIHGDSECVAGSLQESSFHTSGESLLPQYFGAFHFGEHEFHSADESECVGLERLRHDRVEVPIKLNLSSEAMPWKELIQARIIVNGSAWTETDSIDEIESLWIGCDEERNNTTSGLQSSEGLPSGSHNVWVEYSILGNDYVFRGPEQYVEIFCEDDPMDYYGDEVCGTSYPDSHAAEDDAGCSSSEGRSSFFFVLLVIFASLRTRRELKVER